MNETYIKQDVLPNWNSKKCPAVQAHKRVCTICRRRKYNIIGQWKERKPRSSVKKSFGAHSPVYGQQKMRVFAICRRRVDNSSWTRVMTDIQTHTHTISGRTGLGPVPSRPHSLLLSFCRWRHDAADEVRRSASSRYEKKLSTANNIHPFFSQIYIMVILYILDPIL